MLDQGQEHKRKPETKTGNGMIRMHTQKILVCIANLAYQTKNNIENIEVNPIVTKDLAEIKFVNTSNILQINSTWRVRYHQQVKINKT